MRKMRFVLGALAAMALIGIAGSVQAGTLDPVATSGHDADVIFENDGTPTTNQEIGSRYFYEDGLAGSTTTGLPVAPGRTVSIVSTITGDTINYAFNDYDQNNVLMFESGSAGSTLTLDSPAGYSTLAVVFSGGSLSADIANLDFTINYDGGGTQSGVIDVADWGAASAAAGTEVLGHFDRANTGPTPENNLNDHRWTIYVTEITPSSAADILSIDFGSAITLNGGPAGLNSGDDVVVFGFAGTLVPEPATLCLLGLGGLGTLLRRRR